VFGNPETRRRRASPCRPSGGGAARGAIKDGETPLQRRTRAKVVKNKVAAPFRARFDILDRAFRAKAICSIWRPPTISWRRAALYSFESERIRQGRDNAKVFSRRILRRPAR
jgi:recombination protein RecA